MSASVNTKKDRFISVVALALLHVPSGEYMLARRSAGGSGAGEWEFPGGKIEEGESPKEALVREIQEELSYALAAENLTAVGEHIHTYPERQIAIQLWMAETQTKPVFKLIDHDETCWVSPEKMQEINLSEGDKYFISLLKSR